MAITIAAAFLPLCLLSPSVSFCLNQLNKLRFVPFSFVTSLASLNYSGISGICTMSV